MNLLGHTRGRQAFSAPISLPLDYPAAQPHPTLLLLFIVAIPHFLFGSQKPKQESSEENLGCCDIQGIISFYMKTFHFADGTLESLGHS